MVNLYRKEEAKPVGSAADRFKGCKGISSDQYFGREQVRVKQKLLLQYNEQDSHEKLKQFAGAKSISSAQYYGNEQPNTKSSSTVSSIASEAYNLGSSAANKIMSYFGKQCSCLF